MHKGAGVQMYMRVVRCGAVLCGAMRCGSVRCGAVRAHVCACVRASVVCVKAWDFFTEAGSYASTIEMQRTA